MTETTDTGRQQKWATHSFVDMFSGAIKLLLQPLLKEIDAELQVKVFFLQLSDLLENEHRKVI